MTDPFEPHSNDLREYFFSNDPEIAILETIELRHPLIVRKNLCLYSEAQDNGAWGKNLTTVPSNSNASGWGTATACKIAETATTGFHSVSQGLPGLAKNTVYTYSAYLKAAERSVAAFGASDWDNNAASVFVDLAAGSILSVQSGIFNALIASAGSGWYRVSFSRHSGGGGTTPLLFMTIGLASPLAFTYAGTAGSGVYFGAVETVEGVAAQTAYVATTSAPVSRPEPVRFVNDPADLVATLEAGAPVDPSAAVTFNKGAFSFTLPESSAPGLPRVGIEVINIGGPIQSQLEAAISYPAPVEITYRQYLSDDLSEPAFVLNGLTLKSVTSGLLRIQAEAGFEDLLNRPFPRRLYTAKDFPGLVR